MMGKSIGAMAVHKRQTWLSSGKADHGGNTYTETREEMFQVEGTARAKTLRWKRN